MIRFNSSYFIASVFVLLIAFTGLNSIIPSFLGGVFYMILLYTFLIYFMFLMSRIKLSHQPKSGILSLLVFILLFSIINNWGGSNPSTYISFGVKFALPVWNLLSWFPITLGLFMILISQDKERFIYIGRILIAVIIINTIITLYYLYIDPISVRVATAGVSTNYWGLTGYDGVYGSVIILPTLITMALYTLKYKWFYWGLAFLLIIYIVESSYVIGIFGMFLGIGLLVINTIKNKIARNIGFIVVISLILYIFFSGDIVNILFWVANLSQNWGLNHVAVRINELAYTLLLGSVVGDTSIRVDMYFNTFLSFLKHPILGNWLFTSNYSTVLSEHSTILDMLSLCGIVVAFPFFLFIKKSYNAIQRYTKNIFLKRSILISYIVFLYIMILNPIFASAKIMFYPLMLLPTLLLLDAKYIQK